jgi:Fur family peroxide stress response transcriptional regulator
MILNKEVPMEQTTKHFRKRDAILACLRDTDSHPSADWVYEKVRETVPDISLATVYRNLALFKQQGLIQSVATVDGVERFDGNPESHVHFICTSCAAVMDLPQINVPQQLRSIVEHTTGGMVNDCQLSFAGKCQACCQAEKGA